MKPFTKILIAALIVVVAALVAVLVIQGRNARLLAPLPDSGVVEAPAATSPASGFAWRFETGPEDSSGLPTTLVLVDVTYENGKKVANQVDSAQGSCNAVDPKPEDADRVSGTEKIQCYAAGFGSWYKIVKGSASYEVMRKHFEEGVPDEAPRDYPWESIAQLPLAQ